MTKPTTVKIPPDLDHAVSELGFPTRTDAIRRGLEVLLTVADILKGADISRLTVEEIKGLLTVEGQPDTSPLRQAIREEVRAALASEHHFASGGIAPEVGPFGIEASTRAEVGMCRISDHAVRDLEAEVGPVEVVGAKGGAVGPRPGEGHTFAISGDDDPLLRHTMGAERFQSADPQGKNISEMPLKSAHEIPPGDIATLISIRWAKGEEPHVDDMAEILGVEIASLGKRLSDIGIVDRPRIRRGTIRTRRIPASDVNRRAVEAAMGSGEK